MTNSNENKEDPVKPHPINIDFFLKRTNKTTKLVNNLNPDFSVDGSHRWFEYGFEEPAYLTKISVTSKGYTSWEKFEFEIKHFDGTTHKERIAVNGDAVEVSLGKLVTSFAFRPDKKWLATTEIMRVEAFGLTRTEFHEYEAFLQEIERREEAVAAGEAEIGTKEADKKVLTSEVASLESEVGKTRVELETLKSAVRDADQEYSDSDEKKQDIKTELEGLRHERRELGSKIDAQNRVLDELTREVRLFPSEIIGFVREGNRNILHYILLATPFVFIMLSIFVALFSGAVDLTQLWRKEEGVNVWTIFLTRLPFVLISFALIEACGYIVGRLIYEIIRINRQRLEFAKLSIIAKDVSAASANELDISAGEVFERETALKMQLLREHMRTFSDSQFEYKGSALVSALIGVAERLSGGKKPSQE
jgi:hypothetical protein